MLSSSHEEHRRKIHRLPGLDGDGANLAQTAFGFPRQGQSVLAINDLQTETERGEQRSFTSLLIGLFGTTRNPLAHSLKVQWGMSGNWRRDSGSAVEQHIATDGPPI